MNHTTPHTEVEDIYTAVQTGEIKKVKMGDTINGKYVVVDRVGNFAPIDASKSYFIFTETVRNHSTQHTFTESYVSDKPQPIDSRMAHLETLSVESTPIEVKTSSPAPYLPPMKNLALILKATEAHLIDNAWSASDIGRVGLDDCETLTDYEASLLAAMKAVWDDMDLGASFESPEAAVAAVVECVFEELFYSLRSEAARA